MTQHDQKLLRQTIALGVLITALVIAMDWLGGLRPLEYFFYDYRVSKFQHFMTPPSDQLIHLDIGDPDLDTIGIPPWPREYFASVTDELKLAGAKAIGYDIIFSEVDRDAPENDAALTRALRESGIGLIPMAFEVEHRGSEVEQRVQAMLRDDLEIKLADVKARLEAQEVNLEETSSSVNDLFLSARTQVMQDRVTSALAEDPNLSFSELRERLLPKTETFVESSPVLDLLRTTIRQVQSVHNLQKLAKDEVVPPGVRPIPASVQLLPIPDFSAAAAATGFVEFPPEADGKIRRIPLWMIDRGHLYPQFGLALACMQLGVDIADIRIEPDRVIVPVPDRGDVVIPTHNRVINMGDDQVHVTGMMDLPFFGTNDWITMYDFPRHIKAKGHMPYSEVWKIPDALKQIRTNSYEADRAIVDVMSDFDPQFAENYAANPPDPDDVEPRLKAVAYVLQTMSDLGLDMIEDPSTLEGEEREVFEGLFRVRRVLQRVQNEITQRQEQIESWRANLKERVEGKSVIIGWTATGIAADFVPTTLHGKCPGPIVHGLVFNAVMNGEFWKRAPYWVGMLLTIIAGGIAIALASFTGPQISSVVMVAIGGTYFLFNSLVLFDYGNIFVPVAAPLLALGATWSGATTWRFVVERRERGRITSRFASYVDPKLVQYVLEHQDQDIFAGQDLEMTVVFTDLAGFTTLSEALREGIVGILNDYIKLVVPIIEKHNGFVNKFLGDGVMFFYGAPYPNPNHARDAMITAFEMQEALLGFNQKLADQGLPTVRMRVGINTGQMIVGDAGGVKRSDYTVLGDSVNLSARLESANKQTGTLMMVSERTLELMGSDFLVRPLGSLQVVGKSEGIAVYEPLAMPGKATPELTELAKRTTTLIDTYKAADFDGCLAAAEALDEFVGEPTKLAALYRELCTHFKANPPEMPFHGDIVLTSK